MCGDPENQEEKIKDVRNTRIKERRKQDSPQRKTVLQ
jgi:hypothetical protein